MNCGHAVARVVGIALAGVALSSTESSLIARGPREIAWAMLDAYHAGRHEQVVADLKAVPDLRVMAREFSRFAEAWIERAPVDEREDRFRTSAVAQLEVIRETLDRPPAMYESGRHGIEAYCRKFRERAPSPFEQVWMLASVALLYGAHDERMQLGVGPGGRIFPAESHARHASSRFPSEPRFQLAAVPWYEVSTISRQPDDRALQPAPGPGGTAVKADLATRLAQAATLLEAFPEGSPVHAEAQLRIGIVRYQLQEAAKSLAALEMAARSVDPFVAYLAHLSAGRVHESLDRRGDAIVSYRAAVGIRPGAHSGAVSLASLLFLTGARDEAAAIMDATAGTPAGVDPWRLYGSGDLRFWPSYRARLHGFLGERRSRR
jgi:tetratricopeptide (TPR) repeat protein